MATITTDTFLDAGVRNAGEAWNLNGGTLIVRTDTRCHIGAPASMTGSLGAVTQGSTYNGGYFIDGTAVRWMAFSGGADPVPATGTTITQGVVSGYLLGVWPNLVSAPLVSGVEMPATGFLKFREVTGGPFSAGALSGITATADSPDVPGWIEVVHDQAVNFTFYRQGVGFKVRGAWFKLGETTGVAGQIVQGPTNGGGAGTYLHGVFIGDPEGDGEWYPGVSTAAWLSTKLGTDIRAKFVLSQANGAVQIGGDGTTAFGFLPPAGLPIYIPNVLGRQCSTSSRAVNLIPHATIASRPEFYTNNNQKLDIEYFMCDWYFNLNNVGSFRMINSCFADGIVLTNISGFVYLFNCCNGKITGTMSPLNASGCSFIYLEKCKLQFLAAGNGLSLLQCGNKNTPMVFKDCVFITQISIRSTAGYALYFRNSRNIQIENCEIMGSGLFLENCSQTEIKNIDYCDTYIGAAGITGNTFISISYSTDVLIDEISLGKKNTIPNCNNSGQFVRTISNKGNIRIRNMGSPSEVYDTSINPPTNVWYASTSDLDVAVQRLYMTDSGSTYFLELDATCIDGVAQNIRAGQPLLSKSRGCKIQGCRIPSVTTGTQTTAVGQSFFDAFLSDTTGVLVLIPYDPVTSEYSPFVQVSDASVQIGFGGSLKIPYIGGWAIFETPVPLRGHIGFSSTAIVTTGTVAGLVFEYQLDRGLGYSGTWTTLNSTNLFNETNGNPFIDDTFSLKIRITATVNLSTSSLTSLTIYTISSLEAQTNENNLYPLIPFASGVVSNPVLTLFNIVSGSSVSITNMSTSEVLTSSASSFDIFDYEYVWIRNINVSVSITKTGYQNVLIENVTLTDRSLILPINQIEE